MKINVFVLLFLFLFYVTACNTRESKEKTKSNDKGPTNTYVGPNHSQYTQFSDYNFTTEQQWDSLNNMTHHFKPASGYNIHKDYKTFGWHIFSKGSAYKSYNFSLLWGVSYFSYMVNAETGSYDNIHQWKTTALVDSAKVNNCKVFLTVSNFGEKRNTQFLKNPKAQKTLADSLSVLLDLRKANGINIDFEGVSSKNKKEFNQFIVTLSDRLHKINPDYMVSVALYAVDYHKVFDIKTIDASIDFYTLMGYDYYGGFSEHAGPVSPLKSSKLWGDHSIESSVKYYINEGVTPDKLIVGLPYYGDKWKTQNTPIPSKAEKFLSHDMYSTTQELLGTKKYKISFDTISATQYGIYEEKGVTKQLWFDDSLSLSYKYDWIKHKKLAGVGIWALGYDHGYTELWELLADKFGEDK